MRNHFRSPILVSEKTKQSSIHTYCTPPWWGALPHYMYLGVIKSIKVRCLDNRVNKLRSFPNLH